MTTPPIKTTETVTTTMATTPFTTTDTPTAMAITTVRMTTTTTTTVATKTGTLTGALAETEKKTRRKIRSDSSDRLPTMVATAIRFVATLVAAKQKQLPLLLLPLLLLLLLASGATASKHEQRLIRHLTKNYNPEIRPVKNLSEPTEVAFEAEMVQLISVKERDQVVRG